VGVQKRNQGGITQYLDNQKELVKKKNGKKALQGASQRGLYSSGGGNMGGGTGKNLKGVTKGA